MFIIRGCQSRCMIRLIRSCLSGTGTKANCLFLSKLQNSTRSPEPTTRKEQIGNFYLSALSLSVIFATNNQIKQIGCVQAVQAWPAKRSLSRPKRRWRWHCHPHSFGCPQLHQALPPAEARGERFLLALASLSRSGGESRAHLRTAGLQYE